MTTSTAQTVVLVSGGLMLAYAVQRKSAKKAYAAGVITLGLTFLADVAPEVAGPFAALVVMYLATREGLFGKVFGGVAPASQPVKSN